MRAKAIASLNVLFGTWLLISAFVWPHTRAQAINAIVVGVAAIVFAIFERRRPWVGYLTMAASVWLAQSYWFLRPESSATFWNNLFVAIAMCAAALTAIPAEPTEVKLT
jgi:hypothetical protein